MLDKKPLHVLRGHNAAVTSVALSSDLDLCLSASKDATIIVHTLSDGQFVRSIYHPRQLEINLVYFSNNGYLVYYSAQDRSLYSCNLNGTFVTSAEVGDSVTRCVISPDDKFLITAGNYLSVFKFQT
jgi:WD40 repeat protein